MYIYINTMHSLYNHIVWVATTLYNSVWVRSSQQQLEGSENEPLCAENASDDCTSEKSKVTPQGHLQAVGQTYCEHFKDATKYSFMSFKASLCFFCHALWPQMFQHAGSDIIIGLNDEIVDKYNGAEL